ncbi:ABC transporter ATP-binding protein [Pikeienuella sp. HZG-20]|uniref:ABC transporter ATP-binding protein n=1 Tax=Paludibacillus litoralis TaxID=3133267 RepID=UPI0030EB5D9B
MSTSPLLRVDSLNVAYASLSGNVPALRDVSFSIERGEALALVGESGSGKSTVAMSVLGLLGSEATVTGGGIFYDGKDLTQASPAELRALRGNRLSMVFQDPFGTLNPGMRVGQQTAEPLMRHQGMSRSDAMERVVEAFSEVGLPRPSELVSSYPHQLSGGMQQRVLIASALICEPDLIVLDEPTTALDVTIEAQILDLLDELRRRRNLAMLFITHNLGVVNKLCDRVCVLYSGAVLEEGRKDATLKHPRHPYTQGLLGAIPSIGPQRRARLKPIPGHLPEPGNPPSGCVFHPRCPHAIEECRTEPQQLLPFAEGMVRCWRADALPTRQEERSVGETYVAPAGEPLMEARDIGKRFAGARRIKLGGPAMIRIERPEVRAVDGVSLKVAPGEVLGLVGESGSGKSTLGRCLIRLIEPDIGEVVFDGEDVSEARGDALHAFRGDVQIVFQNPTSSLNPRRRVGATIGRSLDLLGDVPKPERRARIEALLESVGLPGHFAERFPHQLSGGERQRVSIARALASKPKFIVCDEPVSSLDVSVQATVLNLLADLREELKLSYLFISHDLSAVAHIADRIAVMYAGAICEEGPTDKVLARPNHPYTEALLSAVPTIGDDAAEGARVRLREAAGPLFGATTGCRFHNRCPRKIGAICEEKAPPLVELSEGHWITCHLSREALRQPLQSSKKTTSA